MSNIVKVECMHFWSDWIDIREIEINLDEYVFFEIDYRGKDSWHIKGHKCDSEYNWTEEELSDHQVSHISDVAKFIAQANAYEKTKSYQPCKVSRFNNLHYGGGFYRDLQRLFELVEKYNGSKKENEKIDEKPRKTFQEMIDNCCCEIRHYEKPKEN